MDILKQTYGNRLFPHVELKYPIHAKKITGMILELDNAVIEQLLEDHVQLHYLVSVINNNYKFNKSNIHKSSVDCI